MLNTWYLNSYETYGFYFNNMKYFVLIELSNKFFFVRPRNTVFCRRFMSQKFWNTNYLAFAKKACVPNTCKPTKNNSSQLNLGSNIENCVFTEVRSVLPVKAMCFFFMQFNSVTPSILQGVAFNCFMALN